MHNNSELNAIEYLWCHLKIQLRRYNDGNVMTLRHLIMNHLENVPVSLARKLESRAMTYFEGYRNGMDGVTCCESAAQQFKNTRHCHRRPPTVPRSGRRGGVTRPHYSCSCNIMYFAKSTVIPENLVSVNIFFTRKAHV